MADAPGDVHEVAQRCSRAVVFFKIPHGHGRGSNDPDGPEDGTARAECSLSAPTAEAAAVAQRKLRELLGAGPALCKPDSTGSPLQAVAGRTLELMGLVDRGEHDVVERLRRMVAKLRPRLASANEAKRRCHMDEQQVERALRQVWLDRTAAPNAFLRGVLPGETAGEGSGLRSVVAWRRGTHQASMRLICSRGPADLTGRRS